MPFTRPDARLAHAAREIVLYDGEEWYAPRRACQHLHRSYTTLVLWANQNRHRSQGCPHLSGRPIRTRQLPTAYGRHITYYRKADLDLVRKAILEGSGEPDYPGLIQLAALARAEHLCDKTVRRAYAKWCAEHKAAPALVRKASLGEDGMPRRHAYVPTAFAQWLRSRRTPPRDPDDIGIEEAAEMLTISKQRTYALVSRGLLEPKRDRDLIVCRGGYLRKGLVLSRDAVLAWKVRCSSCEAEKDRAARGGNRNRAS